MGTGGPPPLARPALYLLPTRSRCGGGTRLLGLSTAPTRRRQPRRPASRLRAVRASFRASAAASRERRAAHRLASTVLTSLVAGTSATSASSTISATMPHRAAFWQPLSGVPSCEPVSLFSASSLELPALSVVPVALPPPAAVVTVVVGLIWRPDAVV